MTVRDLITTLNELGEENLDKEVVMFDGPAKYTPCKVEILDEKNGWNRELRNKILID